MHGGVDIVGEERRVVVDPDQYLGAAAGGEGERIANELAGARFLLSGDGVLEVEDNGVGPAIVGLFHEAPDVDGENQRGAASVRDGHRQMIPFWVSAPMRSSE